MPRQQLKSKSRSGSRSRSSASSMRERSAPGRSFGQMSDEVQSLASDLARTTEELKALAAYGRKRYNQLDRETKRRALAAVGIIAGLLAAGATVGAVRGRKRSSQK